MRLSNTVMSPLNDVLTGGLPWDCPTPSIHTSHRFKRLSTVSHNFTWALMEQMRIIGFISHKIGFFSDLGSALVFIGLKLLTILVKI